MEEKLELENSGTSQQEDGTSETAEQVEELGELPEEEKDANKLAETNRKLFARAKKAEEELKAIKKSSKDKEATPNPDASKPKEDVNIIDQKIKEALEQRELETMEISDELKRNIRAYAKANNISIRETLKSDFYGFLKQKEDSAKKSEEASIGGKRSAPSIKEFSVDGPPKVDMFTEEGQKVFDEWKAWVKTQ